MAAKARRLGVSESQLRTRLHRWLSFEPPARWLLIEPDPELRRLVIYEMESELALPVAGCSLDECANPAILDRALPCVLPSKAANVRRLLPAGTELTVLEIHPVAPSFRRISPAICPSTPKSWSASPRAGATFSASREPC